MFCAELPAAATNSAPAAFALLMASSRACEKPPPPQLFDSTRTSAPFTEANVDFACTAKLMALMASEVRPCPLAPMNFRPIMLTFQFTPVMP